MSEANDFTVTFKSNKSSDVDHGDSVVIVESALKPDAPVKKSTFDPNKVDQVIEMSDTLGPIRGIDSASNNKKDYDNRAFELEDIDMDNQNNPFSRQNRPGSMMSIKSNMSTTSRSSVNCSNGRVKCPNMRLKKFYSYKADTGFAKASLDIKALILPDKDGAFIGNWLLIEISAWDFHREKIAMLTEKTLFVIQYDFIKSRLHHYKRIALSDLKNINCGILKYPNGSFSNGYDYGAVRLTWGPDDLGFLQKWNPFNFNVPMCIFASHHILYNEKEKETSLYNCDEFIASLEYVLSLLPTENKIEIKQEPVEVESFVSLASTLYNQNWLGFQLDRNGVSF